MLTIFCIRSPTGIVALVDSHGDRPKSLFTKCVSSELSVLETQSLSCEECLTHADDSKFLPLFSVLFVLFDRRRCCHHPPRQSRANSCRTNGHETAV